MLLLLRKSAQSLSMQVNGHGLGMERLIRKQQVGTIFIGKSAIDPHAERQYRSSKP